MSPELLIHVEDPGAANWIVPLVPALDERGAEHVLVCEPGLDDYFAARGIRTTVRDPATAPNDLIRAHRPVLLLAGTSENPDAPGLALIDAAAAAGITSVSFVDQAANARHRFRGRTDDPLAHAPDRLFVPDEQARAAFAALGFPEDRLIVTGNPHLDRVRAIRQDLEAEGRDSVRARVAPDAPDNVPIVVFIAEIGYVVNPESADWERNLNFTGRHGDRPRCARILEEVLDALAQTGRPHWFVLRLHPKNEAREFADYAPEIDQFSSGGDPLALLWAADLVVGMSSAPLEEARAMERPVLSVLPHPVERDWLPSLASGDIPILESRERLRAELPEMLAQTSEIISRPSGTAFAADRICDALDGMARAA